MDSFNGTYVRLLVRGNGGRGVGTSTLQDGGNVSAA